MSEPNPPDEPGVQLGKTRLISGPGAVPAGVNSAASTGGADHATGEAAPTQTVNDGRDPSSQRAQYFTAQGAPAHQHPHAIGRFEVRACLGSGAFGWVYHAFDPTLRREVAIKLPRAERLQTQTDRSRFLNEARAAATIRHPHVVPVFEVGESDGIPFIVMSYISGPTLAAMLTGRTEPLPITEAARIVQSLAFAVQAAHDKGVVHRDLKPANVLFDPENAQYVVTDFGLARVVDPSDPQVSTTGVAGTPSYMPPEQARGDSAAIGPRSDVYALGVILFELLTGRLPFTGGSVAEVISKVLMAPTPAASSLQANIPPALDAICRKAMAKSPDERYASAQELAASLDPFTKSAEQIVREVVAEVNQQAKRAGQARQISKRAVIGFVLVVLIAGVFLYSEAARQASLPVNVDNTHAVVPPPKAGFDSAADRRAAEWVLRSGGALEIVDTKSGAKLKPKTIAELPASFQITQIQIHKRDMVSDESVIANLTGLSALQIADFHACAKLTNVGLAHLARLPALTFLGVRNAAQVTDAGLATLERHPTLREVYLARTGITVKGIVSLATIPRLEVMSFSSHAITDDWLAAAANARGLRQLYAGYSQNVVGSGISAAGFAHLVKLKHLYLLDLDSAAVELGALKGLPELPAINQLFLRKIAVTDEDLIDLLKYPNMQALALHESRVTDKGMETVAKFAGLQRLYLDGTQVGDDGLKLLTACEKLQYLTVARTNITPDAIKAFQKALPNCEVNTKWVNE